MACPSSSSPCPPSAWTKVGDPIGPSDAFYIRYIGCGTVTTNCFSDGKWMAPKTTTASNPLIEIDSTPSQGFFLGSGTTIKGLTIGSKGYNKGYLVYSPNDAGSFSASTVNGKPLTYGNPFYLASGSTSFLDGRPESTSYLVVTPMIPPRLAPVDSNVNAAVFVAYPAPSGYTCTASSSSPCKALDAPSYPSQDFSSPSTSVYSSSSCGSVCENTDPCKGVTCVNGSCSEGTCTCSSSCYLPADGCKTACSGHGVCTSGACVCDEGWKGDRCGLSTNGICTSTSCANGGICDSKTGACSCTGCYSGPTCKTTCSGNGTCQGTTCACKEGYTGSLCQTKTPPSKKLSKPLLYGLIGGGVLILLIIIIAVATKKKKKPFHLSAQANYQAPPGLSPPLAPTPQMAPTQMNERDRMGQVPPPSYPYESSSYPYPYEQPSPYPMG